MTGPCDKMVVVEYYPYIHKIQNILNFLALWLQCGEILTIKLFMFPNKKFDSKNFFTVSYSNNRNFIIFREKAFHIQRIISKLGHAQQKQSAILGALEQLKLFGPSNKVLHLKKLVIKLLSIFLFCLF